MSERQICGIAPARWQCLGNAGHEGPCAAAPLTGSGACPDIGVCLESGCQAKCGPNEIELQPHQQRVVDEALALSVKVVKLAQFIHSDGPIFKGLVLDERTDLTVQYLHMYQYLTTLQRRMCRWDLEARQAAHNQGAL